MHHADTTLLEQVPIHQGANGAYQRRMSGLNKPRLPGERRSVLNSARTRNGKKESGCRNISKPCIRLNLRNLFALFTAVWATRWNRPSTRRTTELTAFF